MQQILYKISYKITILMLFERSLSTDKCSKGKKLNHCNVHYTSTPEIGSNIPKYIQFRQHRSSFDALDCCGKIRYLQHSKQDLQCKKESKDQKPIHTHYYFSNLIRWVGSRRVGAPGMTGSHETKSSVIRPFLAHPRDVIRPIGSSY